MSEDKTEMNVDRKHIKRNISINVVQNAHFEINSINFGSFSLLPTDQSLLENSSKLPADQLKQQSQKNRKLHAARGNYILFMAH